MNRAQRSALKVVLERDELAGRFMILCVAAIRSYGSDAVSTACSGGALPHAIAPGEGSLIRTLFPKKAQGLWNHLLAVASLKLRMAGTL